MAYPLTYSVADDCPNGQVHVGNLRKDVVANISSAELEGITRDDDELKVMFDVQPDVADKTALDGDTTGPAGGLIAAHSLITPAYAPHWDCTVHAGGRGDYKTVGAALAAGWSTIFIKNGVYVETTNLNLPSTAVLYGESPGGVVLVMVAGNSVKADGSGGVVETTGTIAVTNGDATVTGTGTTFTNCAAEDWICVDTVWHHIDSITDDTHLELKSPYRGNALSGWPMRSQSMIAGLLIQNIMVYSSSTVGIYFRAVNHGVVRDCMVSGCGGYGIQLQDCTETFVISTVVQRGGSHGVYLSASSVMILNVVAPKENAGDGVVANDCKNVIMDGCDVCMNGGIGVNLTGVTSLVNITDGIVNRNNSRGVNTASTTGSAVIDACTITNNGSDGVDFDGDENVISDCVIEGNDGHGIRGGDRGVVNGNHIGKNIGVGVSLDSDTNCVVSNNVIEENTSHGIEVPNAGEHTISGNQIRNNGTDGIRIAGTLNAVTGNVVLDNGDEGIQILASATDNAITGNICRRNAGEQLLDEGTGTVKTGNIT